MKQTDHIVDTTKMVTAVEWLIEQIEGTDSKIARAIGLKKYNEIVRQAKAMEKEQIIDSFGVGCQVEATRLIGYHQMAEQYYNETYNK